MTKKEYKETEGKIRKAAKKLFLEKGFDATTSREIAKEAGVNLSLLNYHFWSKKELFDLIILETFKDFSHQFFLLINNEQVSFQDKIIKFSNDFFDFLIENEIFHAFLHKEIAKNPENAEKKIQEEMEKLKDHFNIGENLLFHQYQEETKKDLSDFRNFFINIFSLIMYPVLWKKMLSILMGTTLEEYKYFLEERKKRITKLIPILLQY